MFERLKSREAKFFELFSACADNIVKAAQTFQDMTNKPTEVESFARKIQEIEHQNDLVTHETVALLHQTFITPIDRDDIHQLISKMDDVVDFIDAASERALLYQLRQFSSEAKQMATLCLESAENLKMAIYELPRLKQSKTILTYCVEINRIENDADKILRVALARLFKDEPDVRELIKLKEVYELLETVTDRCEDVANVIESIVLEYS